MHHQNATSRRATVCASPLADDTVRSLTLAGRTFSDNHDAGFIARDVRADSDFLQFARGRSSELGLELTVAPAAASNHLAFAGRITDTTRRDRAISLSFTLPVDAAGWNWGDDIRRERQIAGDGEFANVTSIGGGATGTQSVYPFAAVYQGTSGVALGLDMGIPAVYRVGYHAGLKRLFITFDYGLSPETAAFPGSANFRFVLYQFDGRQGFRGALQKYMDIFPEYFVTRSKQQGLWMPFTHVGRVAGWEEFGFRYHEGDGNVAWDDEHDILSFRYTEPMTWWMAMPKELPRTMEEALQFRDQLVSTGDNRKRQMAQVSQLAAMYNDAGQPALLFRDTPWANGAVWSLNPNPWLGGTPPPTSDPPNAGASQPANPGATTSGTPELPLNGATVHWNPAIRERLYGPKANGRRDGEYLDSLEGYVTTELNFRREHFRSTTVPLTFSFDGKQLALFKGLAVFEFTKWLADDLHRMDKLLFANGVPYRFGYLCPWLDVLGTETDWLHEGQYRPVSLATTDLWRTLSGAKPYLLLMNSDYDRFTPELVERYFQRALFYGMWPGFFSHNASENPYWLNPRWYERDRSLFRKYIPVIKRVAEAGWQPCTYASSANPHLLLERFGPTPDGSTYFTLFNPSAKEQTGTITFDLPGLKLPAKPTAILGPEPEPAPSGGYRLRLAPEQTAVWALP
jgi:hypothetical protein